VTAIVCRPVAVAAGLTDKVRYVVAMTRDGGGGCVAVPPPSSRRAEQPDLAKCVADGRAGGCRPDMPDGDVPASRLLSAGARARPSNSLTGHSPPPFPKKTCFPENNHRKPWFRKSIVLVCIILNINSYGEVRNVHLEC